MELFNSKVLVERADICDLRFGDEVKDVDSAFPEISALNLFDKLE